MGALNTATIDRAIDDEAAAARLMQRYPEYAGVSQAIIDAAGDGKADIRGAIAALDDSCPCRSDRGGAM